MISVKPEARWSLASEECGILPSIKGIRRRKMDINGCLASMVDRLHHRPRYYSHASIGDSRNGERERKEWGGLSGCLSAITLELTGIGHVYLSGMFFSTFPIFLRFFVYPFSSFVSRLLHSSHLFFQSRSAPSPPPYLTHVTIGCPSSYHHALCHFWLNAVKGCNKGRGRAKIPHLPQFPPLGLSHCLLT